MSLQPSAAGQAHREACRFRLLFVCILVLSIGVVPAAAQRAKPTKQNNQSAQREHSKKAQQNSGFPPGPVARTLLKTAAISDDFELEMGKIGQKNAQSNEVKEFAKRMIKDHSSNLEQLKKVAKAQQVALPTELDPLHKKQKAALSGKTGAKFDEDYMSLMVQDHEKAVEKFQDAADAVRDPAIKQYAQQTIPVLKSHLHEAKRIYAQLKSKAEMQASTQK